MISPKNQTVFPACLRRKSEGLPMLRTKIETVHQFFQLAKKKRKNQFPPVIPTKKSNNPTFCIIFPGKNGGFPLPPPGHWMSRWIRNAKVLDRSLAAHDPPGCDRRAPQRALAARRKRWIRSRRFEGNKTWQYINNNMGGSQ